MRLPLVVTSSLNAFRAAAALLTTVFGMFALAVSLNGRQTLPEPRFEVVSVKHNTSGASLLTNRRSAGRVEMSNITLEALVLEAFGIPQNVARHLVVGGVIDPATNCTRHCSTKQEVLSARFDISATFPEDTPSGVTPLMVRTLLADRFKLKAHLERREIPLYALTLAREGQLGPQLYRSTHNCAQWDEARKNAPRGQPPAQPADRQGRPLCQAGPFVRTDPGAYVRRGAGNFSVLVSQIRGDMDRLIIDRTGLTGLFEWELRSEVPGLRALVRDFESTAPSIDIALREQLGLQLARTTGLYEMLVIESVQMPSAN